jgi:hypothetical protein
MKRIIVIILFSVLILAGAAYASRGLFIFMPKFRGAKVWVSFVVTDNGGEHFVVTDGTGEDFNVR